jgi:hypothetical protein
MMDAEEIAKLTRNAFDLKLKVLTNAARSGNKKAALNVIKYMTAEAECLRNLGYMTNDNGKIVKFKVSEDPSIGLAIKAAKGDSAAAEELLKINDAQ